MSLNLKKMVPPLLAGLSALAMASPAHAVDKFKVTSVDCEMFWLWKHTPVLHYDIIDERRPDYNVNPGADYFGQAASRTAEFCDRTSAKPQTPLNPPRKIRGIWFQSNDGQFKILYDLDHGSVGAGLQRDDVTTQLLAQPDPGVEAVGNEVAEAVFYHDLHRRLEMSGGETRQHGAHHRLVGLPGRGMVNRQRVGRKISSKAIVLDSQSVNHRERWFVEI